MSGWGQGAVLGNFY